MPSDAELARVPVPSAPRLDALPAPTDRRPIDLEAVAKGYEAMGRPTPGSSLGQHEPTLLVFVSFSIPQNALARLVEQASRAGATLILRGLVDGSLRETASRVHAQIGQRRVAFQIDPQAFDRFSVTTTPTFVLVKRGALPQPCAAGTCFPPSQFVSAAGDVSIDYALEFFGRSSPAFEADATAILGRMKGGS
jgi:conjugal transfer pilus assembly protein TrbC